MTRVEPIHITKQPRHDNSFGVMGNENFLYKWICEKNTCGSRTTYHTTLTDTRLLIRSETRRCCKRTCTDVSVILRDIAEIRESIKARDYCCSLCACCVRCCCKLKFIEVRGPFGSHRFIIPKEDVTFLQYEISVAIGNHKLVSRSFS